MDWPLIQDSLKAWAERVTGLLVEWRDEAQPWFGSPEGHVLLNVFGSNGLGVDDRRLQADASAPQLVPTHVGWRRFTLSILVETLDQRPAGAARHVLERVRTRARFESSKAMFAAAELSLIDIQPIAELGRAQDDRQISAASMDVRFNALSVDVDEAVPSVDGADVGMALEEPDGSPVPDPLQPAIEVSL